MFGKNCDWDLCVAKNMYKMFGSYVVAVVFQSDFNLEMHQDIFFIFKKLFLISTHQNDLKKKY